MDTNGRYKKEKTRIRPLVVSAPCNTGIRTHHSSLNAALYTYPTIAVEDSSRSPLSLTHKLCRTRRRCAFCRSSYASFATLPAVIVRTVVPLAAVGAHTIAEARTNPTQKQDNFSFATLRHIAVHADTCRYMPCDKRQNSGYEAIAPCSIFLNSNLVV